jgi:serine/threonine-protein kinase
MSAHLVERPAPVSSLRREVPAALEALVARCLEKEPARRPQSATEILALLDDPAVVSGEVASSSTPSLVFEHRPRRTRARAAIAAAVVMVVALGAALLVRDRAQEPASAAVPQALSVAIFPLVSISADSADRYVAEGMTEALTNALAALPGVRVASRTAAAGAQRQGLAPEAIATRLGVLMYMEGTVQRSAERIRVTVRLVNASDGFTLWSDVYDRASGDLLTAQSEIAHGVAEAVRQGALVAPDAPGDSATR